jgi:hypothetical protein
VALFIKRGCPKASTTYLHIISEQPVADLSALGCVTGTCSQPMYTLLLTTGLPLAIMFACQTKSPYNNQKKRNHPLINTSNQNRNNKQTRNKTYQPNTPQHAPHSASAHHTTAHCPPYKSHTHHTSSKPTDAPPSVQRSTPSSHRHPAPALRSVRPLRGHRRLYLLSAADTASTDARDGGPWRRPRMLRFLLGFACRLVLLWGGR